MSIAEKHHRYTVQRPDASAVGGYVDVDAAPVWGGLRFASGSEALRFGAVAASAALVIVLWFRADLRADWRLVDADTGQIYQVAAYGDPTDARVDLHVFCAEVQ